MRFLEWWTSLSAWIRYSVALLVIAGSTIGSMTIGIGSGRLWQLAWGLGFILLLIGPSRSEKKGYHF
ncbi:MAG: hypothetical protein ACJ8FY_05660 [Gemmataceae bacterium]